MLEYVTVPKFHKARVSMEMQGDKLALRDLDVFYGLTDQAFGLNLLTYRKKEEPGYFMLGSKSYGRNSAFLLRIGYQQVDDALTLI